MRVFEVYTGEYPFTYDVVRTWWGAYRDHRTTISRECVSVRIFK